MITQEQAEEMLILLIKVRDYCLLGDGPPIIISSINKFLSKIEKEQSDQTT